MTRRHSLIERYFELVEIRKPTECWPWLASPMTKGGYGMTAITAKYLRFEVCRYGISSPRHWKKTILGHRLAWILANCRPIPKGKVIMHLCNNRRCMNPNHLKCATQKDNVAQAVRETPTYNQRKKQVNLFLSRLVPTQLEFGFH